MTSGLQPINAGAPQPVQGVTGGPGINQGTATIDPGSGNLVIHPPSNSTDLRGSTPAQFNVYEYFHTNTDYSRISLISALGGPFQLAVQTQPTTVIRNLQIIANGSISLQQGTSILLGPHWTIDNGGSLTSTDTSIFAVEGHFTNLYLSPPTGNAIIIQPPGLLQWRNNAGTQFVMSLDNTGKLISVSTMQMTNAILTGGGVGIANTMVLGRDVVAHSATASANLDWFVFFNGTTYRIPLNVF